MRSLQICVYLLIFICVSPKKYADEEKPQWAKKDIRDFSDADMERLLDQWDVSVIHTNINIHSKF